MRNQSEPTTFPVEVIELILDELGLDFIDRGGPDYQSPMLRTTLRNLSLSARHLRDHCRRHLWHTLILDCTKSASPEGYCQRVKSLHQALLEDDGIVSCVRRLEITIGNESNYEIYYSRILDVLNQLSSLHFRELYSMASLGLAQKVLEYIQENLALTEVSIDGVLLPASFIWMLPAYLKQLELCNLSLYERDQKASVRFSGSSTNISPERMRLRLAEVSYETLSALPITFFNKLKFLNMRVSSSASFDFIHQPTLSHSPNLQELKIEFEPIHPDPDWMLSDEEQFPNLKAVRLVLREMPHGVNATLDVKVAIQCSQHKASARQAEKLQQVDLLNPKNICRPWERKWVRRAVLFASMLTL
ncbi:hypothetical protein BKA70DRAFT_1531958 [Coprinopsis sp. MPI-PUGE-AT-0042]|nr:hypothetical protein BKA70DRAFT_1531958 [Coprinopsis sp. MPI-PUGE-AT-0042]